MNELLLRIETLCWEVNTSLLIGAGAGMAVVGLILWLGGVRYSTVVIGLLGAAVGTVAGMFVGQKLGVDLLVSMAGGALVLGLVSILLRNVLVIVLATAIFALVAAGGYTSLVLDGQSVERTEQAETPESATSLSTSPFDQRFLIQSFSSMDPNSRDMYVNQLAGSEEGFDAKAKAVLADTWELIGPYRWQLLGVLAVGAIAGFLLIWFIKTVVLPLCYSIVGTAAVLLGAQFVMLGVGFRAASALPPQRWVVPAVFGCMSVIGWVQQLMAGRRRRVAKEGPGRETTKRHHEDD